MRMLCHAFLTYSLPKSAYCMFFHNSVAVVCLTVPSVCYTILAVVCLSLPNVCSTFLANLPIGA